MEPSFTDRQLDIMNLLWEQESATVREAKDEIDADLAYTSVLTIFQTLEKHDKVRHEREGKAYRYYPTVSRAEAGRAAVSYLLERVFDDSPRDLLRAVLDVRELPDNEMDELLGLLREGAK